MFAKKSEQPESAWVSKNVRCNECQDAGWVYAVDNNGEVVWEQGLYGQQTKIVRCTCQDNNDMERRAAYLYKIDGLTDAQREKGFDSLSTLYNERPIQNVIRATQLGRGLITLTGAPGTGKTTLLIAAVNESRKANKLSVYTTVTDLLHYLRAAFNPANADISYDARWDLLSKCSVLALDELDEFNTSPWAMENFLRLIDVRWMNRDSKLTLIATNSPINALPDKVASRLSDRTAQIFAMYNVDMRKL